MRRSLARGVEGGGVMPDYIAMNGPALLAACADDAAKWAAAFRQHAVKLGYSDMDEEWLIGWFANAIERADDERRWRRGGAA